MIWSASRDWKSLNAPDATAISIPSTATPADCYGLGAKRRVRGAPTRVSMQPLSASKVHGNCSDELAVAMMLALLLYWTCALA
jgi:hypothetical protein